MAERMLIVKVVRTNGTRADLYAKGHKWPDLKLFDLSELAAVGLDVASLEVGAEVPCRFWALWEESEKLNQAGNPFKDVLTLEPMDKPATSTSTDSTTLLAELRVIRGLLEAMAGAQGLALPEVSELDQAFPKDGDGATLGDNAHEQAAYDAHIAATGQAPANVEALRSWELARRNGSG